VVEVGFARGSDHPCPEDLRQLDGERPDAASGGVHEDDVVLADVEDPGE
jgi:hypothetical protein